MHPVAGTKVTSLSVSRGYDAIAAEYDAQVRGDDWMRRALHAHYRRVFQVGDRVLDVGCGTGLDAIALARRGVRVVGIDGSAGMIARLHERIAAERLAHLVHARVLNIQDLSQLDAADASFDGLIAAFASLSTVADLARFADDAARLVRPGARLVLHLLNRFSMWEWLGHVLHRNWRAAGQVGRQSVRTFVIGGQAVQHWLYFPDEAYRRCFAPRFSYRDGYAIGAVRPPHTVRRLPSSTVHTLEWLDIRLGGWPLVRNAGRFFVLDLERRSP